jgi:hypothetical protein
MPLPGLMCAPKRIPFALEWTEPESPGGYIRYNTTLEVDGITEAGLILTGGAYSRLPDRHVTFELSLQTGVPNKRIWLTRIDWRSLKGGHSQRPQEMRWAVLWHEGG